MTARLSSERPLVTIVTPCYNSEAFIEETILSVRGQTYPNVEHIVVDGGSSDGTLDIIRRHQDAVSRWVSEPDAGQADALRKGFDMATGEVLAWINSDDVYPADAVQVAVDALVRGMADVVYGNRLLIDGEGRRVGERRLSPFLPYFSRRGVLYGGFGIYQPAAFWTRHLYEAVGGIDPSFQFCMDADLVARFVLAGARFRFLGRDMVRFRVHDRSKTATLQDVATRERRRISEGLPRRSMAYRSSIKLACRAWKALYHLKDGQVRYLLGRAFDGKYRFVP
jgi:glycosyltransferase involved in cell wall biosynthesis